jgi:quinolinate synthase
MTIETMYKQMHDVLKDTMPDVYIRYKAKLAVEIMQLKEERNAVILGHNYMEPALFHFIPDFKGDSLELSRKAAATDKDVIVFCGVEFMAETAKILSPDKTVLVPSDKAGCSLAESITAEDVRLLKKKFPGIPVVTYINTYADVKAECDICCTSGNAKRVVESLDSDTVIFLPDEFLAKNVALETSKKIIFPSVHENGNVQANGSGIIGWRGRCEVHEQFTENDVINVRQAHPQAIILAHPECSPEVTSKVDFSGSTSAMIDFVAQSSAKKFMLLTECSMADNIAAEYPDKELVRMCSIRCPHMAQITVEDTRNALRDLKYEITLEEELRKKAERSVQRMLEI